MMVAEENEEDIHRNREPVEFNNIICPTIMVEMSNCKVDPPPQNNVLHNEKVEEIHEKPPVKNPSGGKYIGLILALISSVCMTLAVLVVKVLSNYHPFTLALWRYAFSAVAVLPVIIYYKYWKKVSPFVSLWPPATSRQENWTTIFWLWVCSATSATTIVFRYFSLSYLTLADATIIAYSNSLVIVFMAHFFLDEKCGIVPILTAIVTFLGIVAISRPPLLTGQSGFDHDTLIGIGFAFGALIFASVSIILLRRVRKIQFTVTLLISGIWGVAECVILAAVGGIWEFPKSTEDICLILLSSALAFLGVGCTTISVKFEQAGAFGLIRTSDIVLSFTWQFIFLSVIPDLWSVIGASIVMTGIVVTTLRKWLSTLPDGDSTREKFKFLLR